MVIIAGMRPSFGNCFVKQTEVNTEVQRDVFTFGTVTMTNLADDSVASRQP